VPGKSTFWERFFSSCYSTNKCYTNLTTKLQKEKKEKEKKRKERTSTTTTIAHEQF